MDRILTVPVPTRGIDLKASKMHYRVKLHENMTSRHQVMGDFLSRSKVKVKCHQNLITSRVHHNT